MIPKIVRKDESCIRTNDMRNVLSTNSKMLLYDLL